MVLSMQMSRPHPKKPHPLQRCDTVVFTRILCYVACAPIVQPLCNWCKQSHSSSCTHLHTGCTSYLRRTRRGKAGRRHAEACKKFGLPSCCSVRSCLLEGPNGGYRLTVGDKRQLQKGSVQPKKGQELVRIPPQCEDDEEVAADVMWPICVLLGKTSFTN